jgi:hypothetical protein
LIILNLKAEYFSKELLKLKELNEMWFQEYENDQEITSGTQELRDSEIKWQ